jgi:hypothetical protein
MMHPDFANEPLHYTRAFEIIQKDLLELFDYIEPADKNVSCYSYRIHALHMRACIEVEANFKAILAENGYSTKGNWNMNDYMKLDKTHHLSAYAVKNPIWQGKRHTRKPFASWKKGKSPDWYTAYNDAKHDRHVKFSRANLQNLVDAICGLVALLSSQFYVWHFSPSGAVRSLAGIGGPSVLDVAIGGFFHVQFPRNYSKAELYNFDWEVLMKTPNPIEKIRHF